MGDFGLRQQRGELGLQPFVALRWIRRLASLVVFSAEDHHIELAMPFEAQVLIRIRGVPEERVGNCSRGNATGDDIARIQRQFRLERRRRDDVLHADQRVVRGDDDVVAGDGVAIRLDPQRIGREFLGGAVFVDLNPHLPQDGNEPGEVLTRVEARLVLEPDSRHGHQRDLVDERRVEPHFRRQRRVLLQIRDVLFGDVAALRVQIAVHPFEVAVDGMIPADIVDL
jgi:hypothetical protein